MTRILPLLLLCPLLLAIEAPDPAWPEGPVGIVGGEETDDFPAVGALLEDAGDHVILFCSATLVEPDLVVTAGHCMDGATPDWMVFGDNAFADDARRVDVASWDVNPLWDGLEGVEAREYDIGLVRLADPVTDIAPIPLDGRDPTELQGETARYVGFGLSDGASPDATKRTAGAVIDGANFYDLFLTSAVDGGPCSGDSGGPLLYEDDDGLHVIGVLSYVIQACGDQAGATRVEEYLDWIADPDGWELPGDGDDDDDDDDRDVVTLGGDDDGQACGASLAPGAAGPLGLLLLLGRARRRRGQTRSISVATP